MKTKHLLSCLFAMLLSAAASHAQTIIAKWTFESLPSSGFSYVPGPGVSTTNFYADGGTQAGIAALTGMHSGFGTPTYSSPVGNGSLRSLSSNGWTNNPGDYYQVLVNTVNFTNIGISFDALGSGTGPRDFTVMYSTDGTTFTAAGTYQVLSSPGWSSTTPQPSESYFFDLSSATALANAPAVYIRLVDSSNTSANGGTVGTGGTSRIDNVSVTGTIAGPPQIIIQPAAATTVNFGDTVTLSVLAGGDAPLSYQWYYPDLSTPLVDGPSGFGSGTISGSTGSTLTLTFVNPAQAGNYRVIVTNPLDSITSQVAQVTINVPTAIATNIAYLHTLHNTNYVLTDTTNLYQIEGIVTTPANLVQPDPASSFFVQDDSGSGCDVFFRGGFPFPAAGDRVRIVTPLLQFNGLLEMAPVNGNPAHSIEILESGKPLPTPRAFDFSTPLSADAMEGSNNGGTVVPAWEGAYVVVSNVFLTLTNADGHMTAGGPIFMTNLTGQVFTLLVPNNSLLDPVGYPLPGSFATSVKGVISQTQTSGTVLTNGYSVLLTLVSDIEVGTPPPAGLNPIPLTITRDGANSILSWSNPAFYLQSSSSVGSGYVTIPGATSPYTNALGDSQMFFRLVHTNGL